MQFTWNDQKNRINIQKHGIDFEDAKELFFSSYFEHLDNRRDYGEDRVVAIGYVNGQPLLVIYTQLNVSIIHLISARVALPHEEQKLLIHLGMKRQSGKSERMTKKRIYQHKKKRDYGAWHE